MPNAQRQNSALHKLNLTTYQLTNEQSQLKTQIRQFCEAHITDQHATFLIQGAAGTAKV